MTDIETPIHTRIEDHSKTWVTVKEWAETELQAARLKNDSKKLGEVDTADLRGRIAVLKKLLTLADPPRERPKREQEEDY